MSDADAGITVSDVKIWLDQLSQYPKYEPAYIMMSRKQFRSISIRIKASNMKDRLKAATQIPMLFGSYDHYIRAMICPLCKHQVIQSEYLASMIEDKKVLYLANLVTHYRHNHISWDRQWSYMQRQHPAWDYDECKHQVNERAKRQYIRKAYPLFRSMGITAKDFAQLLNTTDKTMAVANKFL